MDAGMPETAPSGPLLELALARGEQFAGGGNRPVRLSDPDVLWFVMRGSVDVFAAQLREDGVPTNYKHLLRAGAGRLLFTLPEENDLNVLVAKGLPDSELRRIPLIALTEAGVDARIVEQVDEWISELSDSIVSDVTYRPRIDQSLEPGGSRKAADGAAISAEHGVVWVSGQDGDIGYLGTEELDRAGAGLVPVTPFSWVILNRAATVNGFGTSELQRNRQLLAALEEFNRLAIRADQTNRMLLLADISNLQTASALHRQRSEETARQNLFSVLGGGPAETDERPVLLRALDRIGRHERISFRPPPSSRRSASLDGQTALEDVLNASGVRARRVALKDHHRWWLSDSGAMLGIRKDDGSPVALIPGSLGRYRMVDPQSSRVTPVNAQRAATLEPTAHYFYRSLPDASTGNLALVLEMVFKGTWGDLARLVLAGVLAGLAMLAPAVLLGVFVNRVLPSGSSMMLATVALAMALIGMTLALLEMVKGTALMRLEGRAAARITAALWDRLLVLPSAFFRRFTVGDLGSRALGFQQLRDRVSGVVAAAL